MARSRNLSISASRSASAAHVGGARVVVRVALTVGQAGHDAGGVAAASMNSRSETHLIDTSRRAEPTFPNLNFRQSDEIIGKAASHRSDRATSDGKIGAARGDWKPSPGRGDPRDDV